ncbi:MAG: transcriptional repressor [Clostridia bacterium]|nr:transcriptional repressor [Clostridia bacterium]
MTKKKALLLDLVREKPVHLTAEQIFLLAKERSPGISMATVYNNLGALSHEGLIRRVHIDGQADRYDRTVEPHEHFICDECGEIRDIFFHGFTEELAKRLGERISSYELNVRGVCAACQRS